MLITGNESERQNKTFTEGDTIEETHNKYSKV